jgi:hypothetical protein
LYGQIIGQSSSNEPKTDLKDTKITTVFAINQMAQTIPNNPGTFRKQPNIKKTNG